MACSQLSTVGVGQSWPSLQRLGVIHTKDGGVPELMSAVSCEYGSTRSHWLCVWEIDAKKRQVAVYTSPKEVEVLGEDQVLSGEPVLPGFSLPLRELFAELDLEGKG